MRDLKFEYWDGIGKKMYPVKTIEFNGYIYYGEFHSSYELGKKNLRQFTGLKDMNGKDIYFDDYVEDEVNQIWIVKWNKTEIDLLNISTGDIMSIRNNLTIKSNVYENEFKFTPKYTEIS